MELICVKVPQALEGRLDGSALFQGPSPVPKPYKLVSSQAQAQRAAEFGVLWCKQNIWALHTILTPRSLRGLPTHAS
jgi:hypothetical protein